MNDENARNSDHVKTRLQLNTRLLPILVIFLSIWYLVEPYRGWRVLLAGLGGMWLTSYLWARSLKHGLYLTREMRFGWAQVGDRLQERFILNNAGWAPGLWVEVTDQSTMPDYRISRVVGVGPTSHIKWYTSGICSRRGLFTLGQTTLRSGDPFGVYTVIQHYAGWTSLMVKPPIVPLPAIEVTPGGRAGEGRPRPNAPERTITSAGVREYMPGDSQRWIHWRVSAHRDDLYVRLFEGAPAGDWWIFLDLDQEVQAGEGQSSTEEHGIILAASLADRGLRDGLQVGLVTHGEELTWLPPKGGDEQRMQILRALASVKAGPRPLAELLTRVRPAFGQVASLIIITPSPESTWVEALMPLLRRGAASTVLLLDPVSFGGDNDMSGILALLTNLGVTRYIITKDLLDRPEASPGHRGHWKWKISPTGRAIPVHQPGDTAWHEIG